MAEPDMSAPSFWLAQAREPLIAWLRRSPAFIEQARTGAWLVGTGDRDLEANWLALHRADEAALGDLAACIATLRARGLPATVVIAAEIAGKVEPALARFGMEPGEPLKHELLDLASLQPAPDTPAVCKRVADDTDFPAAQRALVRGLGYPAPFVRETFPPDILTEPGLVFRIAELDGEAVAVVVTWRLAEVVYVLVMGTDPAYRRRGIGCALLTSALLAERDGGGRFCHLVSSDMGVYLYRAAGFRRLADHPTWLLPIARTLR